MSLSSVLRRVGKEVISSGVCVSSSSSSSSAAAVVVVSARSFSSSISSSSSLFALSKSSRLLSSSSSSSSSSASRAAAREQQRRWYATKKNKKKSLKRSGGASSGSNNNNNNNNSAVAASPTKPVSSPSTPTPSAAAPSPPPPPPPPPPPRARTTSSQSSSSSSAAAAAATESAAQPSSSSSLLKTVGALSLFASIGYGSLRAADSPLASDFEFKTFELLAPIFSRAMDAESAHNLGVSLFANGLYPIERRERDNDRNNAMNTEYAEMREMLRVTNVFKNSPDLSFPNPIGLAAGFDKDAKTIQGMREIGFGFVEIGSVTPKPQDGNPKPRVFRLRELDAVINRYGFNSEGIERAKERLKKEKNRVLGATAAVDNEKESTTKNVIAPIGVNLGKNKTTPESEAAKSYALGATELGPFADYLVINVSSPNTPGLRDLQKGSSLVKILRDVVDARDQLLANNQASAAKKKSLPVLVKIAPDVDEKGLKEIAKAVKKAKIDGVIISNTTIERNEQVQQHENGKEIGGLSGKPVFEKSTEVLRQFYELTGGSIPLVGCGGVFTGEDALKKIKAGASLVQLYTSFAYAGPALIPKVKRELYEALKKEGFKNVNEAVGYDVKQKKKRKTFLFF
jgi:dihydroorotate dehydrogenase